MTCDFILHVIASWLGILFSSSNSFFVHSDMHLGHPKLGVSTIAPNLPSPLRKKCVLHSENSYLLSND